MTDEEYYAELRAVAQALRAAGQDAAQRLTVEVRDATPDWLLERLDSALRAATAVAGEVGRFIREDRAGHAPIPAPGYGDDVSDGDVSANLE